jgi:hypothetical protein
VLSALGAPSNPTKWNIKLNATNGSFTGSFVLEDAPSKRTVPFGGVLRQPSDAADDIIGNGHCLLPSLPTAGTTERTTMEILFRR